MTEKKQRDPRGRKTRYTVELGQKIASDVTHMSIKEAYIKNGIVEETYYKWLHLHPEFEEAVIKARKTKAHNYYEKSAETLQELHDARKNPLTKDLVPSYKLLFDGYLRLAGKANQGLFGDKPAQTNLSLTVDNKDVDVPARLSQEEWLKKE